MLTYLITKEKLALDTLILCLHNLPQNCIMLNAINVGPKVAID